MTALLAEGDVIAAQISSNSWATGAPQGRSGCSVTPSFPGFLHPFVVPLEQLRDAFPGDPVAVYQASRTWEQETGDIADAGAQLAKLRSTLFGTAIPEVTAGDIVVTQITDQSIWSDMQGRIRDRLNYG